MTTAKTIFDDIALFLTGLVRSHPEVGSKLIACGILASAELQKREDINFRENDQGVWVTNTGLLNAAARRHGLNFWTHYVEEDGPTGGCKTDEDGHLIIHGFHVVEDNGYPAGRPRLPLSEQKEALRQQLLDLIRIAMDITVQIEMDQEVDVNQLKALKTSAEAIQ